MNRRIAVPVSKGILDGHFGHCRQFALIDTDGESIREIRFVDAPPHEPGLLPRWLAEREVTDVIAGGMGHRAVQLFNEKGINVFVGAPRSEVESLAEGFLKGTLSFSANYCDH